MSLADFYITFVDYYPPDISSRTLAFCIYMFIWCVLMHSLSALLCLFGAIINAFESLFLEWRDPSLWTVKIDIRLMIVLYAVNHTTKLLTGFYFILCHFKLLTKVK